MQAPRAKDHALVSAMPTQAYFYRNRMRTCVFSSQMGFATNRLGRW